LCSSFAVVVVLVSLVSLVVLVVPVVFIVFVVLVLPFVFDVLVVCAAGAVLHVVVAALVIKQNNKEAGRKTKLRKHKKIQSREQKTEGQKNRKAKIHRNKKNRKAKKQRSKKRKAKKTEKQHSRLVERGKESKKKWLPFPQSRCTLCSKRSSSCFKSCRSWRKHNENRLGQRRRYLVLRYSINKKISTQKIHDKFSKKNN
jgi:ABC-type multidrug transport system fused ATPase/permease subunit